MVMQIPEFFNRATRLGKVIPILIETHEENGVEWGVSLTSSNPEPEDYYACQSKEEALSLKAMLEETN